MWVLWNSQNSLNVEVDLISIVFDNIIVCDVKYLPSWFDYNVIYVLPHFLHGTPNSYGYGMDGMKKMYGGHA